MLNLGQPPIHVIRTGKGAEGAQGEPTLQVSVTSNYSWIYDDRGSGANMDITIYRPTPTPTDPPYRILGDYAQGNYSAPTGTSLIVRAINDDPNFPLLKTPIDYREVWNDKGSGGTHDGSIWFAVPPDGYLSIGYVAQSGYSKPSISNYVCVRKDLCVDTVPGPLIWNDKGSGANKDVSLYQIIGVVSAFVAQGNYNPYTGPCYKLSGM
jgi:Plant protein of unknown function (DUF946).